MSKYWRDIPQRNVMLKNIMAAEVSKIKAGVWVVKASPDSLHKKKDSICVLNIKTGKYVILEDVEGYVLAATRKVAVVG
jgi:uncharacterized membrane protein